MVTPKKKCRDEDDKKYADACAHTRISSPKVAFLSAFLNCLYAFFPHVAHVFGTELCCFVKIACFCCINFEEYVCFTEFYIYLVLTKKEDFRRKRHKVRSTSEKARNKQVLPMVRTQQLARKARSMYLFFGCYCFSSFFF